MPKILVVDDMKSIVEVMISYLRSSGGDYDFLIANDGREACKQARQHLPDLIIMDWEMPVMKGIDALKVIKKHKPTSHIPVIISSSFTASENLEQALEAGAIDYLRKPVDKLELQARVKSVLNLSYSIETIKKQKKELDREKEKSEQLLRNILPGKIIEELKEKKESKPQRFKNVTVLFADLVDFTKKTCLMSPGSLIGELNDIFSEFDSIMERNGCERIKTMGDGYIAVCGLPVPDKAHAENIIQAAWEIRRFIIDRNRYRQKKWKLRIGISTGEVVAGIVGRQKYLYDVFGDTMNTAARMQQHCSPFLINISESTYKMVQNKYHFYAQKPQLIKGKGELNMYFLKSLMKNPLPEELIELPAHK